MILQAPAAVVAGAHGTPDSGGTRKIVAGIAAEAGAPGTRASSGTVDPGGGGLPLRRAFAGLAPGTILPIQTPPLATDNTPARRLLRCSTAAAARRSWAAPGASAARHPALQIRNAKVNLTEFRKGPALGKRGSAR